MAINPNELRLGNWIQKADMQSIGVVYTIHGIKEDSVMVYPVDEENGKEEWINCKELQGIPLTNDLLEKLGFNDFNQGVGYSRYDITKGACAVFISEGQVKISDDTSEVIELPERTWYIHNVQNIIFEVSGAVGKV
jgi:hypothetical protein